MAQARSTKLTHARTTCRLSPSCRCGRWNLRRSAPRKQQLPLKSRSAPHSNQASSDQARNRQLCLSRAPTSGTSAESSCSYQLYKTRKTNRSQTTIAYLAPLAPSDMFGPLGENTRAGPEGPTEKSPCLGESEKSHNPLEALAPCQAVLQLQFGFSVADVYVYEPSSSEPSESSSSEW